MTEIRAWALGLDEIRDLIGDQLPGLSRATTRLATSKGFLSDEERKNSWTLSDRAGQVTPDGMQRLLSTTD